MRLMVWNETRETSWMGALITLTQTLDEESSVKRKKYPMSIRVLTFWWEKAIHVQKRKVLYETIKTGCILFFGLISYFADRWLSPVGGGGPPGEVWRK